MCEGPLKDKVREQLVGISSFESGGPLLFRRALDLIMDVDESALRSLDQSLQSLRMKEVPGGKFGTIVSYLKGV